MVPIFFNHRTNHANHQHHNQQVIKSFFTLSKIITKKV